MEITNVYTALILLMVMVLPLAMALNTIGKLKGVDMSGGTYDPKVLTPESISVLRDIFITAYESALESDRAILKSLYISVDEHSLGESISAMMGTIRAESSGVKVILLKMLTVMMFNHSPDILETVSAYGSKMASLHGINVDDLVKDLPSDTDIENPVLLLSMAIILTTADVVPTSES